MFSLPFLRPCADFREQEQCSATIKQPNPKTKSPQGEQTEEMQLFRVTALIKQILWLLALWQFVAWLQLNMNWWDLKRLKRWSLFPNSTSCLHTPTSAGSQMGKWLPSATRMGEWMAEPEPSDNIPSVCGVLGATDCPRTVQNVACRIMTVFVWTVVLSHAESHRLKKWN